jgi:hypothetical protein
MRIAGLTENHERSLLASVQHASTILRDCEAVLVVSDRQDPLSRYTNGLPRRNARSSRTTCANCGSKLARVGVELVVPEEAEQTYIHEKYLTELISGTCLSATREGLLRIVDTMKARDGVQAIVLAGTELPSTPSTSRRRP